MSSLTNMEKRSLEKLFQMGGGYVLSFSDRTFNEFILDSTGKDASEAKYCNIGISKAKRLRAFWSIEPDHVVAKLLSDLLDLVKEGGVKAEDEQLFENCRRATTRLAQSAPVVELDAIIPNTVEKDFSVLAKNVRESIEKNEPESGLDRLHTFVVRYMRVLCQKHGIATDKDKPLHSLLGEYIKHLKEKNYIESEMTERILKSSISILESFNSVRNNQSFAHDNKILNYEESLLIFNNISSAIRFIEALEKRIASTEKPVSLSTWADDDIPF